MTGLFERRQREWPKLVEDARTPFMVGRLVGAAEMTAHMLGDSSDPIAKHAAGVMGGIVTYFFDDVEESVRVRE